MRVETSTTGRRSSAAYESPLAGAMTLRELVDGLVRAEVAAYEQRRADRVLARTLSPAEIAGGAARGKVDSGGRRAPAAPPPDEAVATALEAFDDGLWFVFVDGRRLDALDDLVDVRDDTTVRFVRLVALAGG